MLFRLHNGSIVWKSDELRNTKRCQLPIPLSGPPWGRKHSLNPTVYPQVCYATEKVYVYIDGWNGKRNEIYLMDFCSKFRRNITNMSTQLSLTFPLWAAFPASLIHILPSLLSPRLDHGCSIPHLISSKSASITLHNYVHHVSSDREDVIAHFVSGLLTRSCRRVRWKEPRIPARCQFPNQVIRRSSSPLRGNRYDPSYACIELVVKSRCTTSNRDAILGRKPSAWL